MPLPQGQFPRELYVMPVATIFWGNLLRVHSHLAPFSSMNQVTGIIWRLTRITGVSFLTIYAFEQRSLRPQTDLQIRPWYQPFCSAGHAHVPWSNPCVAVPMSSNPLQGSRSDIRPTDVRQGDRQLFDTQSLIDIELTLR